jgi:hypothetical protein
MIRATERWQERTRYAVDTGSLPAVPGAGSARLPRLFLFAFLVVTGALAFLVSYAGRGPAVVARAEPLVEARREPSMTVSPEPARRRSVTPRSVLAASRFDPARTDAEPTSAAALVEAPAPTVSDPVTTGATSAPAPKLSRVSAAPHEPGSATASRPEPVNAQTRSTREPAHSSDRELDLSAREARRTSHGFGAGQAMQRATLRQARLSADPEKTAATTRVRPTCASGERPDGSGCAKVLKHAPERAALPVKPRPRPDQPKPQSPAAQPRPERLLAAAPTRVVTVCVYFVLCF